MRWRLIIQWILESILLSCACAMISGLNYGTSRILVMSALLLVLVDSMLKPLLEAMNAPGSYLNLCIVSYLLNAVILFLLFKLVPGASIGNIGEAFLASLFITIGARILDPLFRNKK